MLWKYLLVCLTAILLSGCAQTQSSDTVSDELKQSNNQLKDQIIDLESQISSFKNKLDTITGERDEYLKQLDEFYLTDVTGTIDLIYWDDNDMITALGEYNEKFKTTSWKTYVYRRSEKDFYWQLGGSFIKDPFFELRRKNQDHELDVFHFRIERLAINNNRTLAQETYNLYLQNVLKHSQIDPDLYCYQQVTCRDIQIIKCTKDNKNYHSWFEGSHLFTSRFDDRAALDAFETFYCHN